MAKERPEALAEFAETARKEKKKGRTPKPLTANEHTIPVPEDNAKKHDIATTLLSEGAEGDRKSAESDEAIHQIKDRIRESRD
jgi:hypothetical protein